jgi:DNA-binding Lrp family transcriptional regulator
MKDVDLRLVSELMKNSRRSDRELARALGVSQPTVSRTKARLEKEGYISEYTMIPNFNKLGYHLFALTFFSWKQGVSKNEMEEAIKFAQEKAPSVLSNVVLIERGIGLNYDSFMGSFHKDYSSYTKLISEIKKNPYLNSAKMESFIVNLDDEIHYRTLTFSTLAKHLLETNQEKEWRAH